MVDLIRLPALELARLIRRRDVSAVEVVRAHQSRIAAVDPAINAVVATNQHALKAAAGADRQLRRDGPIGPLHGVPFTVKDIIETADLPTVVGMPERRGAVPVADAPVVARLRAAGAILLAKTNCPYGGGGIETDNEVFGRTNNPYDSSLTPGGSSGGEAALIAAGGSPVGLGSDSGGSIRLPAHFCGVATIKPTAGLVPLDGVLDEFGPLGPMSDPRTQVGVLGRSAADLGPVLAVVAADAEGWETAPVPVGSVSDVAVAGLRVGVIETNGLAQPTAETISSVRSAAAALVGMGALRREVDLPSGGHELTNDVWRSYGPRMSAPELYAVLRRWDAYRREMAAFMSNLDLLLTPVFPVPAVAHGATRLPGLEEALSYTTPFSLTGWPCAVVRAGWSTGGLPIGVQLVARPWRDAIAIAAAMVVESAAGGWLPVDPRQQEARDRNASAT